jgi:hypothetical protein
MVAVSLSSPEQVIVANLDPGKRFFVKESCCAVLDSMDVTSYS